MKSTHLYWRNPTKEDLKFGFGSILYREFDTKICLNCESKIHLSIIANDDKQRYYSASHEYSITRKYKPILIESN